VNDKREEAIELLGLLTPAVDGRFIVGDIIGYGRWGITVKARDVSGRIVALKVAWRDQDAREHVLRETELTAKIDHPSVLVPRRVEVPEPLLVVETTYMANSLGDWLDAKKPIQFETVRDMLLAIGPVLDKAHSVGIVHGGILPEKIFVDENGRYFIGDFSLRLPQAVFVEGNRPSTVGFDAYTPMEQRHDLPATDGRIDEFSLAVVAYELLRGARRWRFGEEGVLEIDSIDMVVSRPIAAGAPPMASASIRRATSREAAFRYPSAGEFVRAFAGLSAAATPAEQIFRQAAVVEKRRSWLWLLPIAACVAAAIAFRPAMRDSAIRLWRADWTSDEFWHGNLEMSSKPASDVGMNPGNTVRGGGTTPEGQTASTQRSNGTGGAPQSTTRGDGRTTVGGPVNPGPNIDPFPRVQKQQGGSRVADGSNRAAGTTEKSASGNKPVASSSSGDAAAPASRPAETKPTKPAATGPGSIEVSITGAEEAEVYIDGRSHGRAPVMWQAPVGKHIVTVRPASRFTPTVVDVNVTTGSTVRAVFTPR
jgi:serine/threonine protein kinase